MLDVKKAAALLQCLADNGVEPEECKTVAQAIGYILLDDDIEVVLDILADPIAKAETEATESCPYCGGENVYPNLDAKAAGYKARCTHCMSEIFLCDECLHAKDCIGGGCDWREENGKSVCHRGVCEKPSFSNISEHLPLDPSKDGSLWFDGMEILGDEEHINALADAMECAGESPITGFYDPEEDKKSGETDDHTGFWYLH